MQVWLSAGEGAKRLHVARRTFQRIAKVAGVRTQVLPGMNGLVRYSKEDIERVARESVIEPGPVGKAVAG